MATPQRKLHSLERIVAASALVLALALALALSVGSAQAESVRPVFLRSSSALVQDVETGEVVINKNADAVVPIASITKLMTAMVILDRSLDLDQRIVLSREDIGSVRGTRSRLRTGSVLKRGELLLLSLMASENRATAALGRTYPGGTPNLVTAMNAKAAMLGMADSHFVEPTGLSPANVASARDLAKLVRAAHGYPLIRKYSTQAKTRVRALGRPLDFNNTNGLVANSYWEIDVSKTGYISEAGRCLVMHVRMASRELIVVLLDSWGKRSRFGDANRIRNWLEQNVESTASASDSRT